MIINHTVNMELVLVHCFWGLNRMIINHTVNNSTI